MKACVCSLIMIIDFGDKIAYEYQFWSLSSLCSCNSLNDFCINHPLKEHITLSETLHYPFMQQGCSFYQTILLFRVQHSTLSEYLYKLPVWGWALHSVRVIMYTSCLGLSTALCQSSYVHFMFLVKHWTLCHLQRYSAGKGCCLSITFFKMLITNLMWTHQKNLCKHIYQFLRKKRVKRTIKWQNINFLGERETCWNWWQWKKVSPIMWQ